MNIKDIKNIIKFISKLEIKKIKVETKNINIEIEKNFLLNKSENKKTENKEIKNKKIENEKKYIKIKSPITGTFYSKPNPESKNFIEEGDIIEKGKTICIIESMKIFNEIKSENKIKIIKIFNTNNSLVEYNNPLFLAIKK